jgi:hypothetical protein
MPPVVRISDEVYSRLEQHAVGFDSPSSVIERILDHYERRSNKTDNEEHNLRPTSTVRETSSRLYSNSEIQQKIAAVACELPLEELERLCSASVSKELFGINFPLFVRVPELTNQAQKKEAVKIDDYGRWTWKYEFTRNGFAYAICTQWYPRNDSLVRKWLESQ